jgi:uncharacterized protein YdeI (YjbR/CyaY-like superfamily)
MLAHMKLQFFKSQNAFRRWLEANHQRASEVWLGIYKAGSGKGGLTYRQALDEALCYGWIDGVRKRVDDDSFTQRFSPRTANSRWSAVNVRRVKELTKLGLMRPAGIAAFERRRGDQAGYSFEERPRQLPNQYEARFQRNARAWAFFSAQPPGYRRATIFWVTSAKKEETRRRRLQTLIEDSASGHRIDFMRPRERKRASTAR